MSIGLQPAAWHEVYSVIATAGAALLGLFFVAVSLHLRDVERNPILRMRAQINFLALAGLVTQSIAVLIPGQSNVVLGDELVIVIVGYYALLGFSAWRASRVVGGFRRRVWIRLVSQNVVGVLQVAAGFSLVVGQGPGLFFMAPGLLLTIPLVGFNLWRIVFAPELERPERPLEATKHVRPH